MLLRPKKKGEIHGFPGGDDVWDGQLVVSQPWLCGRHT